MHFHKPLILDIFKRMVFSRRHEDYVSGNRKKRGEVLLSVQSARALLEIVASSSQRPSNIQQILGCSLRDRPRRSQSFCLLFSVAST